MRIGDDLLKRISIFIFCILLVFVFSFPVFASNSEIININDIFLVCDHGGESLDLGWSYYKDLSPQQVIMCNLILESSSLELNRIEMYQLLEDWEMYVYKGYLNSDEMIVWESVEYLFDNYIYKYPQYVKIVFSEEFVASINYWVWAWNQQNNDTVINTFTFVSSFDLVNWNDLDIVYYMYTDIIGNGDGDIHPGWLKIVGYEEFNLTQSQEFGDFWDILINSLDVDTYVSWLPSSFSAVFLNYWYLVLFPLMGALVLLKVLHG